jgi:hypothetical protein
MVIALQALAPAANLRGFRLVVGKMAGGGNNT